MRFTSGGRGRERGVTPVIGIILVVAVAVIISAVVGGYVFGLYDDALQDPTPQVNWEYDYDSSAEELVIRHEAGDAIDPANVHVRRGDSGTERTWAKLVDDGSATLSDDGRVAADATATIDFSGPGADPSEGVTIYWRRPDPDGEGGRSAVLGEWDGP